MPEYGERNPPSEVQYQDEIRQRRKDFEKCYVEGDYVESIVRSAVFLAEKLQVPIPEDIKNFSSQNAEYGVYYKIINMIILFVDTIEENAKDKKQQITDLQEKLVDCVMNIAYDKVSPEHADSPSYFEAILHLMRDSIHEFMSIKDHVESSIPKEYLAYVHTIQLIENDVADSYKVEKDRVIQKQLSPEKIETFDIPVHIRALYERLVDSFVERHELRDEIFQRAGFVHDFTNNYQKALNVRLDSIEKDVKERLFQHLREKKKEDDKNNPN